MGIQIEQDDEAEAPEPGEIAYQLVGESVRSLDEVTLMALVNAIRRDEPWTDLAPKLRRAFVDLESELEAHLFEGD
jgi:hypothetical protein